MKNASRNGPPAIGKFGSLIVFAIIIFVAHGCNLSRVARSGNSPDTGSGSPASSSSDQCSNAYYPIGPTVVRKYRVTYPKGVNGGDQEYTESFSDFSGDTFVVNSDLGNIQSHVTWKCTTDGLLATEYSNFLNLGETWEKIETLDSNGVTLPPEDSWNVGEKWHALYHTTETMTGLTSEPIKGDGDAKFDGEIIGSESVTVPAGTFQAMKVRINSQVNAIFRMNGKLKPTSVPLETTAWFAKGVGMVRSKYKMTAKGDSITELVSSDK